MEPRYKRSVQLHPTRLCNLRCSHCYSHSGPEQRGAIDDSLLEPMLLDAWEEGFGYLSVSGGEPLMWRPLPETLRMAKSMGYLTGFTTNATLATSRRIEKLTEFVHLVAVSVDGDEVSHNALRGSSSAYRRMLEGVRMLVAAGITCGFVFTLTQQNCHQIEQLIELAAELGVSFVQVHPLEASGAARDGLSGCAPDTGELFAAAWNIARLYDYAQELGVRLRMDTIAVDTLVQNPARVNAVMSDDASAPLADALDAIIVEPDGVVVPLSYGFTRKFAVGNLYEERLSTLARKWMELRLGQYRQLCRLTLQQVVSSGASMINWTELVREAAAQ